MAPRLSPLDETESSCLGVELSPQDTVNQYSDQFEFGNGTVATQCYELSLSTLPLGPLEENLLSKINFPGRS